MFTMIKQICESVKIPDTSPWSWTTRPNVWEYFRAEYKQDAQRAYEYWTSTGRLNYGE